MKTNPLWLSREWLIQQRLLWPFPVTPEEQRLCDAGMPWEHLRANQYTEGPDQAHLQRLAEGADVRAPSARRAVQLELAL